ncbi:MAG: hypothetical protein LBH34_04230 [Prevotellaceae bacterium]|jgi:hypothetical protein|nr:hypothetical protein [Prevotellaceae bacterium]
MKKNILKICFLAGISTMLVTFSSCLDEGKSTWSGSSFGVIIPATDTSEWWILADDQSSIYPLNEPFTSVPDTITRISFEYFGNSKTSYHPPYTQALTIGRVEVIQVNPIIVSNKDTINTIPNDRIYGLGLSGGLQYLNTEVAYLGTASKEHLFYLTCDSTNGFESPITLELRHNKNGDNPITNTNCQDIVSFDMESLKNYVNRDSFSFKVKTLMSDSTMHLSTQYTYFFKKQ